MCASITKEKRDAGTVDLTGFFLYEEVDDEDETIFLKIAGAVALLIVAYDREK